MANIHRRSQLGSGQGDSPRQLSLSQKSRDHCAAAVGAEVELGAMQELPADVARARYGRKFAVPLLGATEKKDGSYRMIHDGTHGTAVNSPSKLGISCARLLQATSKRACRPCRGRCLGSLVMSKEYTAWSRFASKTWAC